MQNSRRNYYRIIAIGSLLFLILIFLISWQFLSKVKKSSKEKMAENIEYLANIFSSINECCGIVGFERDKTYIDFLNVKNFVGAQVGGMVLKNPENWQGPYLSKSPKSQDKEFQIVKARDGYFIIPGDGVAVTNGKVINKTVEINEGKDVTPLINYEDGLRTRQGKALAKKIPLIQNVFENLSREDFIDPEDFTDFY